MNFLKSLVITAGLLGFIVSPSEALAWTATEASGSTVSQKQKDAWALAITQKLREPFLLVKTDLSGIKKRIKESETAFLRLEFERAWGLSQEVILDLEQQWPQPDLELLWQKALGLAVASGHELGRLNEETVQQAFSLSARPSFNSLIGSSLKEKYFSELKDREIDLISSDENPNKISYFFGKNGIDRQLRPGHWFVQSIDLDSFQLSSSWTNQTTRTETQSLGHLAKLKELFQLTRPDSLALKNIRIELTSGQSFSIRGKSSAPVSRKQQHEPMEVSSATTSSPSNPLTGSVFKNLETKKSLKKENKILKSPWFWAVAGGLAIGSGFLAYELSRPDKVRVPTP